MNVSKIAFGQNLRITNINAAGDRSTRVIEINGRYTTRFNVFRYAGQDPAIDIFENRVLEEIEERIKGFPIPELEKAWIGFFKMMSKEKDGDLTIDQKRKKIGFKLVKSVGLSNDQYQDLNMD